MVPLVAMVAGAAVFVYLAYYHTITILVYIVCCAAVDYLVPGSDSWMPIRHWTALWTAWKAYFSTTILVEQPLRNDRIYVYGLFPHGVVTTAVWANFIPDNTWCTGAGPYVMATLNIGFFVPLFRELLVASGFVSASRTILSRALQSGTSVVITVGGAQESLHVQEGIILHKRRGFVRLALENGALLVPVYTFGERNVYDTYAGPRWIQYIQRAVKRVFHFTTPLFWGRYFAFPKSVPLTTVIGKPVPVPHESCSVDDYHAAFVKALCDLHERHRHDHGEGPLNIIA